MQQIRPKNQSRLASARGIAVLSFAALATSNPAGAEDHPHSHVRFVSGNLVVSRSVYDNNASNVKIGALLPTNCASTVGPCAAAINNGIYPFVFNNVIPDASFGITSKIILDQITPPALSSIVSKSPTTP
jgi:hypothetical protein